jgi:signal transduction histidine kinase
MNAAPMPVLLAWTSVYVGLSVFYWILSYRVPERGTQYLSLVMAGVALMFGLLWTNERIAGGRLSVGIEVFLVAVAAVTPPLHSSFLLRFAQLPARFVPWVKWSYALAASILVLEGLFRLSAIQGQKPFDHPSVFVALGLTAALLGHIALAIWAYWSLFKSGRRAYLGLLGLVLAIAPGILLDFALTFWVGQGLFISSFGFWVYGLGCALVVLNDLRGAEGLLALTATSLKERTQELEISHAELELVHSELTQKEQLAAVGELAQAIAHEVRNPLAVIVNAASGLRRPVADQDRLTLLSIIDEEAARLNELVSELLRFARPMNPAAAVVDIEEICAELLVEAGPHEIVFQRDDADLLPELQVDAGLMRLGLGNLVQNAAQAMLTPGVIRVVVRRGHLNDGSPSVVVEVRDSGVGMSEDVLERAKKPFFTTRPRGTGLGLSIVDRIVEAHEGELELSSVVGKGTTICMRFPILEDDAHHIVPPSKRRKLRRRRNERLGEAGDSGRSGIEKAEKD